MGDTYSKIDTGFYYLRVENLGTNGFVVGNLKWLNLETFETLKRYQICTGDVLISIAGSIGRAAVFDESSTAGSTVLTENCAKLHLGANVLPEYFRLILSSTVLQAQMQRDYIQTTIPKLGLDRIRQLRIPKIPEISRQMEVIASWKKAFEIYETTILDASTRLAGIDDYLLGELGIVLPEKVENTIANRIFKTTRRELTGWRFDPQALHPEREAAIHEVKKLQARPLKQVVLF